MIFLGYYKKHHLWLNVLFFAAILYVIGVFNYIPYSPNGIHLARQTDGYSFILHYANNGMNLFQPGNLNVESSDGRCVSELPILYYLEAIIYKSTGILFGLPESISVLFLLIAFWACNSLLFEYLKNRWISFATSLILFSSTVLLYYSHRNMPDAPALAFLFLGFRNLYMYPWNSRNKIFKTVLFLTLATLFKPALFFFQGGLLGLTILFHKNFQSKKVIYFQILGVGVILAWVFLINFYNTTNHVFYYTTQIRPFWTYSFERTERALDIMWSYWYSKYYFQSTLHLFGTLILVALFNPKVSFLERVIVVLSIGSSLVYFALFTEQFIDHDYYFIPFIPTLGIVTAIAVKSLLAYDRQIIQYAIVMVLAVISVLSLDYARINLMRRFFQEPDLHTVIRYKALLLKKKVDELDPTGKMEVIVYGEHSRNISLVFLNRRGWAYKNDYQMDKGWVKKAIKVDLDNYTVVPGE